MGLRKTFRSLNHQGERGQTLVIFVFGLAALMGMAALTIDVGLAYVARRDMQNSADAAALAGADVLLEGFAPAVAANAARGIAQQNGYEDAAADVSVTVNIPPTSGPYSGDSDYVEVVIEQEVDTYLARAVGRDSWDVTARAVAGINRGPKPYGIITLNKTACESMEFNGTINVTVNGGAGTFTNSECNGAAFVTKGTVNVDTAANDIVGGWQINNNSQVELPPYRAGHMEDPLGHLVEPIPPSGPIQTCPTWDGDHGTRVLEPGVYDCEIDPSGSWGVEFLPGDYLITGGIELNGNNDFVFGAGTYTLQGAGLKVTGNGTVLGDDVTFYIDEGQVVMTGTGDIDLSAPETGDYAGVVIFQDRSLTSTVKLSGNAIADGWGTVYAFSAQIDLAGNTNTGFQFISDTFLMSGTSNVTINFDGGILGGAPAMRLVE